MKILSMILASAAVLAADDAVIQGSVSPMPLHSDMVEELRSQGKLDEVTGAWKDFNVQTNVMNLAPDIKKPVTSGSGIAILVDFEDNKADTVNHPPAEYDTMLFSVGLFPTGSMKDFYIENSYDTFKFSGEVSPHPDSGRGWHRIAGSYDYWSLNYGFNHSAELAQAAVAAADPYVDFGDFDNDGPDGIPNSGDDDGAIDAVYIVHAGPGYEENHCGKIWSHMSGTYYETADVSVNGGNIRLERYSHQPEEKCSGALVHMGVFAHEYGHILGLPDLYDYDYDAKGVGDWSIMASGSWNNSGHSPAHFDAWCKYKLGWVEPEVVTDFEINAEFPAVEFTPKVYKLWTDGDTNSRFFFLAENRQKLGLFDYRLPGEGLLIYHVDDLANNNDRQFIPGVHTNPFQHYRVAVEQADGSFDLERNVNDGDPSDPFPGFYGRQEFAGFMPYPTSRDYFNEDTKVGVLSISSSDSVMYANLDVGRHLPYFKFLSVRQFGPGGRIEPGEAGTVVITVENVWGAASNLEAELEIDHDKIDVTKSMVVLGEVGEAETVSNMTDPFQVSVAADAPAFMEIEARVVLTETTTGAKQGFNFPLVFGWPGLLVVNDAEDEPSLGVYTRILDDLNVPHEAATPEDLEYLQDMLLVEGIHDSVLIWFTGLKQNTLSGDEEQLIEEFLNRGGKLILSSQNLGEDRGTSPFYTNVLHAQYVTANEADIIIKGTGATLLAGTDEEIAVAPAYGTSKDGISASQGALPVFTYEDGNAAALSVEDGSTQIVYLALPFEGMSGNPNMVITQETLMARMLYWFGYEYLGVSEPGNHLLTDEMKIASSVVRAGEPGLARLSLHAPSRVELTVFDASGRRIAAKSLGILDDGEHGIEIPTTSLAAGVYFIEARTNETNLTTRLVVVN